MKQHEAINNVLEQMYEIGGIPTNKEFMDEFVFRLSAELGLGDYIESRWITLDEAYPPMGAPIAMLHKPEGEEVRLIVTESRQNHLPGNIEWFPLPENHKRPELKLHQVWWHKDKRKENDRWSKRVVNHHNIDEIRANIQDYEFVSDRPHGDGDFSYLCSSNWCKCQQ